MPGWEIFTETPTEGLHSGTLSFANSYKKRFNRKSRASYWSISMSFRDALQTYIDTPERHPSAVLFSDENVVIIKDMYPKSMKHYLILPRSHTHVHPLKVFEEYPEFYKTIAKYVSMAKNLLLENLVREGVEGMGDDHEKFKNTFIKAGVHTVPSLRNLHVHIITKDFHSARLKNKKHYNSFTTDFFVDFADLDPQYRDSAAAAISSQREVRKQNLDKVASTEKQNHVKVEAQKGKINLKLVDTEADTDIESVSSGDDESAAKTPQEPRTQDIQDNPIEDSETPSALHKSRREPHSEHARNSDLNSPLLCVYCGRNFGNKFTALKGHLESEFRKRFKGGQV